jgi:two-component system LytT family sensor kinase
MKKAIWHTAGWAFFFYIWYRYFVVSDGVQMALLIAFITTLFTAFTFYFVINGRGLITKSSYFVIVSILFILIVSFTRTTVLLATNRLLSFGLSKHFYFMGEFISSAFHISYAFILACAAKFSRERQLQQIKAEQQQKEKIKTELEFLKNQVNPHFLFNIHNSIYFLIHENPDKASNALLKLSEILRYQLHECNAPVVPLAKELHNISNYIELEKLRAGEKITVEYQFADSLNGFLIAPFILLSIIENAFKHVSHFPDMPNFIRIEGKPKEKSFCLSVINSADEAKPTRTGIGLNNLQRRLKLIYENKYELHLANADNIFTAHLTIPLS